MCGCDTNLQFIIQCPKCDNSIHYTCSALPLYLLLCLAPTTRKYTYEKCSFKKYADLTWTAEASEAMDRMRKVEALQTLTNSALDKNSDPGMPPSLPTPLTLPQEDVRTVTTLPGAQTSQPVMDSPTSHHHVQGKPLGNTPQDMDLSLIQQTQKQSTPTQGGAPTDTTETVNILIGIQDRHPLQSTEAEERVDDPHSAATNLPSSQPTQVCRFYKQRCCKNGFNGKDCKSSHQKPCQKFIIQVELQAGILPWLPPCVMP